MSKCKVMHTWTWPVWTNQLGWPQTLVETRTCWKCGEERSWIHGTIFKRRLRRKRQ